MESNVTGQVEDLMPALEVQMFESMMLLPKVSAHSELDMMYMMAYLSLSLVGASMGIKQ
jgi:hypothetical protein